MKNNVIELTIVLPIYNEESNISGVIENLIQVIDAANIRSEIIAINDCSSDDSARILNKLNIKYKNLKVFNNSRHLGYGAILSDGFNIAQGKYIIYCDSDNQYNYYEITKFIKEIAIGDYDLITGYRKIRNDSLFRRIISRFYNNYINKSFNLCIADYNCGFKIFKKDILKAFKLNSISYFLSTELLILSNLKGYKIKQIEVDHFARENGRSSVNLKRVYLMFIDLIKIRREIQFQQKK